MMNDSTKCHIRYCCTCGRVKYIYIYDNRDDDKRRVVKYGLYVHSKFYQSLLRYKSYACTTIPNKSTLSSIICIVNFTTIYVYVYLGSSQSRESSHRDEMIPQNYFHQVPPKGNGQIKASVTVR